MRVSSAAFSVNTMVRTTLIAAIVGATAWATGCAPTRPTASPAAMQGQPGSSLDPLARRAADLEARMMIGPVAARSLGLHPTWTISFAADAGVARLWSTDVGVFVLDGRNELSMVDTNTGLRKWRGFIADPGDHVLDLKVVPEAGLVLILRTDALVTIDLTTGFPKGALDGAVRPIQRLQWLARTGGAVDGTEFIYGGLGGEVVWQSWNRGFSTRAHRVGRRIAIDPVLAGRTIVASSKAGHISALDATTGSLLWSRKMLDELAAPPVCTDQYAFVSGLDQHLRCLDLGNQGRPLWTALLEAPLRSAATLIGDHIYQQVPGVGLTAWEAAPANSPDGVRVWEAPGVTGDVLSTCGNSLLTWQSGDGALATVSPSTGSIDVKLDLAPGTRVQTSSTKNGRVFVIGPQGRVESLIPGS